MLDTDSGGKLVIGRFHLRGGKRTGEDLDREAALLFSLADDGRIIRVEAFPGRVNEAYAAAGLERPA